MKFKHGTRRRALEYEKDWVQRWKQDKTFEKSVENRSVDNAYVFYDGPPFITGVPHHGTLLSSIVKDAVPRYWTMKGKRVERVWGWDCHGLPAEVFTEKKLGIKDRRDIGTKISLEEYITTARDNMVQTSSLWNDTIDRIGRWVDMEHAYKTMDKEYMESIWWGFKTLYDKGKIYEGERVLMYCTRDATPLSKAEVTMDAGAYQDVTDPSVYVKFKLKGDKKPKTIKLTKDSKVLFVCAGNLGRSQAAMSLFNFYTKTQNASGAGTEVDGNDCSSALTVQEFEKLISKDSSTLKVLPTHKVLIEDYGIDIAENPRRQLSQEMLKEYDLVVNIAERTQTPDWLQGSNVVWWDIKDVGQSGSVDMARKNAKQIESRVKKLVDDSEVVDDSEATYLLAWTTTPWTLPANTAVGVGPKEAYAEVEVDGEHLILHRDLVEKVMTDEKHQPLDYKVVRELRGKELVGLEYEPLLGVNRGKNAHKVWEYPDLSAEEGTGIVHLAPAYGEEDFELAKATGIPVVHVIDENGLYTESDWKGENVWEANKPIAKKLHEDGIVWKIEYYRHSYPHCHRCGTRLMYRAHPSWFFDVQDQKQLMLEKNTEQIEWFPEHLKHGRWEKNIQQAPDWNLSRDRFWATAMPVWEGTDKEGKKHQIVVGSYDELEQLSGQRLEDYHRPWVDEIEFDKDGVHYTRIDKVLDGWFESGSMPYAQFHYPFENKEKFEANFPGDFIAEYIGQVRAWFYYVHVIGVGLFGESAFKNVITTGVVAGNDGRKMSKSYGNFTDPNELMDKFSADSLRFLLLSSPLLKGEDFALLDKDVGDVARKLSMIWNMYDFFTMYAEVDGWEYKGELTDPLDELKNPLDIWIVSRLHQLVAQVEQDMDHYNIPDALSGILPFLDDASNWYVRRSRRRFWKSEDDGDKNDAYRTLHYVLVRLAYVLAPFTPFLAEELYHNLTGDKESVHLKDWLPAGHVDEIIVNQMTRTRELINAGLSLRMKSDEHQQSIKVRQPLQFSSYAGDTLADYYEQIIAEELNVKEVRHIENLPEHLADYDITNGDNDSRTWIEISKKLTPELKREGLMREIIRHVQSARKKAGLNVDDRITLQLTTGDKELQKAIDEHQATIEAETLATFAATTENEVDMSIDGAPLHIALERK